MKESDITNPHKTFFDDKIAKLIPISCHFDSRTLLTKNGDLMQIIEVAGFEPNDELFKRKALRTLIREFISNEINSPDFALYFHVLNRKRDIMPSSNFPSEFAQALDDQWCQVNDWDHQLSSTLYITIVVQGMRKNPYNPLNIMNGLSLALFKKRYFANLSDKVEKLTRIIDSLAQFLSRFGSKVLQVEKIDDSYISAPLSFLHNLIHLSEKNIPVDYYDASDLLANLKINYLFNQMEITNSDGEALIAAMFTFKPIHDHDLHGCEEILNHNFPYIISETLLFAPKNIAIHEFKARKEFLEAGRDSNLLEKGGIGEIFGADAGTSTDYCKRQITVTLYCADPETFTKSVKKFLNTLQRLGIVVIREDFNMAQCFWSRIPGNFGFLVRGDYNASKWGGMLAFVPNDEIGSYNGSKWGDSVTLFRTVKKLPYYFNFHAQDNGNTLIVGPSGSGKSVLAKFLLAQSTKYHPKIIYIDIERDSPDFIEALGGIKVQLLYDQPSPVQIDYLNIANFENNQEIFRHALVSMLFGKHMKPKYEKQAAALAERIATTPGYSEAVALIKQFVDSLTDVDLQAYINSIIEQFLTNFCSRDDLSILETNDIVEINLSKCIGTAEVFYNFIALLLSKISNMLDGKPTIILLNRCQDIFTGNIFLPVQFSDWLQKLSTKNAIAIFSTTAHSDLQDSGMLQSGLKHFATQIFLSDKFADKSFKKAFALSDDEIKTIKSYASSRRVFLLKQHNESVAAYGLLDELGELAKTLGA